MAEVPVLPDPADDWRSKTVGELLEEIERLNRLLDEKDAALRLQNAVARELRAAIGERIAWETRPLEVAQKWRDRNRQLAQELQLAQVGLTSGCGCPIGECQQRGADQGSCWMLWAEAHVLKRMANMRIGDLQNASRHPSRFAQARAQGRVAPRLASPEPQPDDKGLVREPGIDDCGSGSSHS